MPFSHAPHPALRTTFSRREKDKTLILRPLLFRALGLAKTPAGYVIPADLATVTPIVSVKRVDQLLRDSVIFAEAAGNLVVLKTPAAAAQPVARALDATPPEDALGTVGGDDTIFVAFRHATSATAFA